jgi:ubiquitin-protein ligase
MSKRVMSEYASFQKSGHKTLFLEPLNESLNSFRAIVVGPPDTPFEGGFFRFTVTIPPTYPMDPPKFKTEIPVRLHPNLYKFGKVCLSILGTWGNMEWSPLLTLEKVLMTIQGIMNENPIVNEPNFERLTLKNDESARTYALVSRYLTQVYCVNEVLGMKLSEGEMRFVLAYYDANQGIYTKSRALLKEHVGKKYSTMHEHEVKIGVLN